MRRSLVVALVGVTLLGLVAIGGPVSAAFPGRNGRIAFSTDFARRPQIYTIRPDGSGLRQLTHVAKGQAATQPELSADGSRIALTMDGQIWVMNADGSGQQQLTGQDGFEDGHPSWSPNGSKIVFSHCNVSLGFEAYCDIDVMNADGTGAKKILGGDWRNREPEYSPDGRRIAFSGNRGGYVNAVWVMNANGSKPRRLTDPNLEANNPDWSPDGTKILFGTNSDRPRSDIWVMNADGSDPRNLSHMPPDGDAPIAAYSPDGRKIVLLANLQHPAVCCWDMYLMNPDGTNLQPIPNSKPGVVSLDWGARLKS